jgi:hypothetical protein
MRFAETGVSDYNTLLATFISELERDVQVSELALVEYRREQARRRSGFASLDELRADAPWGAFGHAGAGAAGRHSRRDFRRIDRESPEAHGST